MFCALLTSRYQVSVYRTNGPLVYWYFQSAVYRFHHTNTLMQELNGTTAYEETSTDEKTAVNIHSNESLL